MCKPMKMPKLPADMQVKRLKAQGVTFAFMTEREAIHYLETNHNCFRLQAFERPFSRRADGSFVELDFGCLRDLYIVDARLRQVLLSMCMDVEQYAKVHLMKAFDLSLEDGYAVVADFEAENGAKVRAAYQAAQKDPARSALLARDVGSMPIWTFIELIDFSLFTRFFDFFAWHLHDQELIDESFRLMTVAQLRDSLVKNQPLLSDLSGKATHKPNYSVMRALGGLPISKSARKRKMGCEGLRRTVTLLYAYASLVPMSDMRADLEASLHSLSLRAKRHLHFYEGTPQLHSSLVFLCSCVDNLFPKRYTF